MRDAGVKVRIFDTLVVPRARLLDEMAQHTYSPADDRRLAEMVANGAAWKLIARELERSVSSVWGRATRLGLYEPTTTHTRLTPQQRSDIIRRYQDGETLAAIARAHGRSVGAVSAVITRMGMSDRRPDNGPVRRRTDGTRECRVCRQWLVETAFATETSGTCRECRNERRRLSAASEHLADAPSRPRRASARPRERGEIAAADLADALDHLVRRYNDSADIAREEIGLTTAQWRRLRDEGARVSIDVADRILTAVDMPERLAELLDASE